MVGLFAGIGGLELGLAHAGMSTTMLCELDDSARAVLKSQFGLARNMMRRDVRELSRLPRADILAAGFPCQDLSQAGRKAGIGGSQSSLVGEVFRLLDGDGSPTWVLLENVSYMLSLDHGRAMLLLVSALEELGFTWAYRVVDARSFGAAQRRQRVLFLASRSEDPRAVLFADESEAPDYDDSVGEVDDRSWYGFYWTEGLRGLGWTKDAVPTIKGGSLLGIPSPPAIWVPATGQVGTPGIEDLEALQGFDRGWTSPALESPTANRGARFRLVGNAVCTEMSAWVGRRIAEPGEPLTIGTPLPTGARWPTAAWGVPGARRFGVPLSMRPLDERFSLSATVRSMTPLSARATAGFLSRARRGKLRFADGFLSALDDHLDAITTERGGMVA
jgi:DNA (cytosine-5)-methyltransferase 1